MCHGQSKVAIKALRYPMASVGQLMTLYPDLAVIFLVRDPRGFFWSRMKVFGQPKLQTLPHFAQEMCRGRMLKDVRAITELFLKAPHRVRFLRYEDLAMRPVEVSRNIYRFADLAWTDGIQSTIINQTYYGDQQVTDQSTNQPTNQSINQPLNQSIDPSINKSIKQASNQAIHLSIHSSIN